MKIQQLQMKGILNNFNYIKQHKYDLIYIINTHQYFDHIKGNRFFESKTDARIINYETGLREIFLLATPYLSETPVQQSAKTVIVQNWGNL